MIRIIFYTIVVVLVLSFFGVSIQSIVHSPAGQENFGYVWSLVDTGWSFIVNFITSLVTWGANFTHHA